MPSRLRRAQPNPSQSGSNTTPWQSKHPAARTHLVHADQVFATVADAGVVEFADSVFHLFTGVVLDNTFPVHAVNFGSQKASEAEVGGQRVK